jgi:hypothetical protein
LHQLAAEQRQAQDDSEKCAAQVQATQAQMQAVQKQSDNYKAKLDGLMAIDRNMLQRPSGVSP